MPPSCFCSAALLLLLLPLQRQKERLAALLSFRVPRTTRPLALSPSSLLRRSSEGFQKSKRGAPPPPPAARKKRRAREGRDERRGSSAGFLLRRDGRQVDWSFHSTLFFLSLFAHDGMASMLRGTVPPMQRRLQQLSDTAAASASQHQLRCRAERAESIAFVDRRLRRGHSNSFPPSPSPAPLSAAAASPSSSRRPAAVAASASRRAAAASAAAAVVEVAPPSLLDPAVAALEAIKAFFASPLSPPPLPSSLAAALAAAAALPPARRDALAALATAIGAYALVKFFDRVATKGWLDQVRKEKRAFAFSLSSLFLFPLSSLFLSLSNSLIALPSLPPPPPNLL